MVIPADHFSLKLKNPAFRLEVVLSGDLSKVNFFTELVWVGYRSVCENNVFF